MPAMPSFFDPLDPNTVSGKYLRQRTGALLAAMERGELPGAPLPDGWFRCFTCRRESVRAVPDDEAEAEYRRRFPGEPFEPFDPASPFVLCDDCNRIISEDQGVPL